MDRKGVFFLLGVVREGGRAAVWSSGGGVVRGKKEKAKKNPATKAML
jgi:hypothetical protein